MNNRRKLIAALGAGVVVAPFASFAQQPAKNYRIGYLDAGSSTARAQRVEYIRSGLRELGYLDGKNILIESRWANGKYDQLPALAAELVRTKVDIIVTSGTPCTMAAKQVTATIPIVMASVGDPLGTGLVTSLARPTGNVTGWSILSPELTQKLLQMVTETSPRAKQTAFLVNPRNPSSANNFKAAEIAAKALKITLQKYEANNLDGIKNSFASMAKKGIATVVVPVDTIFSQNYAVIAVLAETHRIPAFGAPEFADAGALIGLGPDSAFLFRRTAYYIDKILKGAKPSDIPVEQPTVFETVVNLKTAKALGIKIPNIILTQATRVIE
jgi:putative ABC transport system substrate-binding protein